jgi:acyl-CoA synthetase (AMP-forming)/AMP-acid ligase II/peptidoglycan/LPS O-acetylase OafA/YrhL
MSQPPFKFVILACSATASPTVTALRDSAKLNGRPNIHVPSFHIVGIEDKFKAHSEELASFFIDKKIMYLPGGHAIGRIERNDAELTEAIEGFVKSAEAPSLTFYDPEYTKMSDISSVALLPKRQVALVKLDENVLPLDGDGPTIVSLLEAQPSDKPFLHVSRVQDPTKNTTYGDILNFIRGGDGDLRRLGVKEGEVVVYGSPPGGGAPAAVTFISIGAQTAAAPLAPGTTEPDALDALDQFDAKHLILFEGVKCPGVEAAFTQYAAQGKGKIHWARIIGDDKPGLFKYVTGDEEELDAAPLVNPADGTCLLLRTSGTTARPKGVPLEQAALVINGAILASSMGLTPEDVVYSIMPLFHIGGISASILCTLASGGAVSCDGEGFDPDRMIDALALSRPQPTWYSSVPTIHNATVAYLKDVASSSEKHAAYGIGPDGSWKKGHKVRMIRSGAAALLGPDGEALAAAYGGVPIYPTYSMSEQMPISQPPAGKEDTLSAKPGSVGVPVSASTAIVSRSNLRPMLYGEEGEIAISGPTVLRNYLENPDADRKSYFYLSLELIEDSWDVKHKQGWYFLTGDVGTIDKDGFLSLHGRAKELIKKGGEQVSPFEVEEPLLSHQWVKLPICFSVPSKLYGEEVGCALVLSKLAPENVELRDVIMEMRSWLKDAKLAPSKWPTKWKIVLDSDLPKTATKKYIRIGLSAKLDMDPEEDVCTKPKENSKAHIDWGTISGARFILACYVMFMHIGSNDSWGAMSNLRGFPWHVHVFFTLGGYSMASPMNPIITKKFNYFLARIGAMYPMYVLALIFCLGNLLVNCRPSTFSEDFHWDSQPNDLYDENGDVSPLFCEGTPATKKSYWASLILTILTYLFGMAVTPFWPLAWNLGYYLWFNSMYYQCLAYFPATYNALYNRTRKNTPKLLKLIAALMLLNFVVLVSSWFIFRYGEGYNHFQPETGKTDVSEYTDGHLTNALVLSYYLFGPFWGIYFVIGAALAFLYDAYRPTERHNAWIWGWVADGCTLVMLALSVAQVAQGNAPPPGDFFIRPELAQGEYASQNRLWDNMYARMFCPVTTLWLFALSTGEGYTARFLRSRFLVEILSPNSYNCFLFHQVVAQWYYAATRDGHWWNWWRYRKTMYWFSPKPCPVEWYEYPLVIMLVVAFSTLMNAYIEPGIRDTLSMVKTWVTGAVEEEEEDTGEVLLHIIEGMTGIEPELDSSLEDCGLASIGAPVLVALLNKAFSTKARKVTVAASDFVQAETIAEMVEIVDAAKDLADADGV